MSGRTAAAIATVIAASLCLIVLHSFASGGSHGPVALLRPWHGPAIIVYHRGDCKGWSPGIELCPPPV